LILSRGFPFGPAPGVLIFHIEKFQHIEQIGDRVGSIGRFMLAP
jgi:hypothetical protein